MKQLFIIASLLMFTVVASPVSSEELNYNLVNLFGAAEKHIDNDLLKVTMQSSADADSAQEAAKIVNQEMNWALDLIKDTTGIRKQTVNYQTRPRYSNKVIVGWSASQQLQLESKEINELSHVVGRLQENLQVNSMNFAVSPAQKKAAADELISEALAAFEKKARLISETVGARDFRIVTLSVAENAPAIPYQRSYQAEAMAMAPASAPQLEAGESRLVVRVDGTIQLVF